MDKKTEIEALCKQIEGGSNKEALAAVEILRKNEWLSDASLLRVSLIMSDLSKADLSGANLSGVNLGGTNLENANLEGANLENASLERANLSGANLSEANLERAILDGANLSRADLRGTILVRADLSYAGLIATKLNMTNLTDSIFYDARCEAAIFSNVDLSKAIGLETVRHDGPSTIGIDTIYRSNGKIPKKFLRGCGVPETMIEYIPYMMEEALQYYSCFISYSHADKEFARKLHDTLQERGIRCWLDEKQLKPGHDVHEEIARGIRHWDKLILCCSEAAISSWWVHNEIEFGFQKEAELTRERGYKVRALIPLDLDGHIFKDGSAKVVQLRANRFVGGFQGWQDNTIFNQQVEALIAALRTDEGREVPPLSRL